MTFDGYVWRIVPAGAFALHVGYILKSRGRWNREGVYGCLYTALSEDGALGEAAKYLRRAGIAPRFSPPRDLVSLRVHVGRVLDLTYSEGAPERVSTVVRDLLQAVHDVIRRQEVTYPEFQAAKAWMIEVGEGGLKAFPVRDRRFRTAQNAVDFLAAFLFRLRRLTLLLPDLSASLSGRHRVRRVRRRRLITRF